MATEAVTPEITGVDINDSRSVMLNIKAEGSIRTNTHAHAWHFMPDRISIHYRKRGPVWETMTISASGKRIKTDRTLSHAQRGQRIWRPTDRTLPDWLSDLALDYNPEKEGQSF